MMKHSEIEKTVQTALKKMEEINSMDIEEIDGEEIDMLKDCMKILCLEKDLKNMSEHFEK